MKITTSRTVPFRRSPAIDIYLGEEDVKVLYEKWGTGVAKFGWSEPISMRGGIFTISVKMLKEIPESELLKVYYKKRTQRIMDAIAPVVIV